MHDLSMMAATEWAKANAFAVSDPIQFGSKVALVYCACRTTQYHAGDEKATAAALAALSIRPETLQAIALLSSLCPLPSAEPLPETKTNSTGTEA